jgi:putative flippase GtrA
MGVPMSLVRKLARYATVSVISTSVSLTILGVLVATSAVTAGWANVIATAVGTIPSFELNRRWVWGRTGRRSALAEVLPFCALSFVGLGLSTLAVSSAAGWAVSAGLGTAARTVVAQGANVATFGTLWVVQYVLLDRVLFARGTAAPVAALPDRGVRATAA